MACRLSRQKKSVKKRQSHMLSSLISNRQGSALSISCIHVNHVVQHRLLSAACQNGAKRYKVVVVKSTAHTCTIECKGKEAMSHYVPME